MRSQPLNPVGFGSWYNSSAITTTLLGNILFQGYENGTFKVPIMFEIIMPTDIMFIKAFPYVRNVFPNLTCNIWTVRPTYSNLHGLLNRYTMHLVVHVINDLMWYVTPVPCDVNSISLLSCNAFTLQTLHFLQGKKPFKCPKKVGRVGGFGTLGANKCLKLVAPLNSMWGLSDNKGQRMQSFLITGQCLLIILF